MKQTILSLAAMLLISCSAGNEVTAQNVSNAGKTLVVYYSYTNKCHEIVETLTTQITADVLRVEPEDKTQKYEATTATVNTNVSAANGKAYTLSGQVAPEGYKGVVIQNGQKRIQ